MNQLGGHEHREWWECVAAAERIRFFFLCSVYVSLFVAVIPKFVQNFSVQEVWGTVAHVAFTCRHEVCLEKKKRNFAWLWKWWKLIKRRCLYHFFSVFFYLISSLCIIAAGALRCFCAYNWTCAATGSCIQRQHFDHMRRWVTSAVRKWALCEAGLAQFEIYSLI